MSDDAEYRAWAGNLIDRLSQQLRECQEEKEKLANSALRAQDGWDKWMDRFEALAEKYKAERQAKEKAIGLLRDAAYYLEDLKEEYGFENTFESIMDFLQENEND